MFSKDNENFMLGALVGGALGAVAALLLTPYSGAQIRKQVQTHLSVANGKKIRARAHPLRVQATKLKKAVKKTVKRVKTAPKHTEKS